MTVISAIKIILHFCTNPFKINLGKVRDAVSMLPKLITIAKTTTKPHKTESNAVSFVQTVPTGNDCDKLIEI